MTLINQMLALYACSLAAWGAVMHSLSNFDHDNMFADLVSFLLDSFSTLHPSSRLLAGQ